MVAQELLQVLVDLEVQAPFQVLEEVVPLSVGELVVLVLEGFQVHLVLVHAQLSRAQTRLLLGESQSLGWRS